MHLTKSEARHYREIADRYKLAVGEQTIEAGAAVRWALDRKELELLPATLQAIHAERLSEAMRMDVTRDRLGRKVRLRHCVKVPSTNEHGVPVQRHLWAHVDDAPDEHLRISLLQRRDQIQCDVDSLRADLDFANERLAAKGKSAIQMSFDFNLPEEPGDLSA